MKEIQIFIEVKSVQLQDGTAYILKRLMELLLFYGILLAQNLLTWIRAL